MNQLRGACGDCTLVVNAGGGSRRMGQPKALLTAPGGGTLLAHTVRRLSPLFSSTLIITNDAQIRAASIVPNIKWLSDDYANSGPLAGVATALAHVDSWVCVVACDLPLIEPALVRALCATVDPKWDAVVPVVHGRVQPLLALYHPRCLSAAHDALNAGRLSVANWLHSIAARYLPAALLRPFDPALHSFVNVNTPNEWLAARKQMI